MEPVSLPEPLDVLEAQIRQEFGRVVYSNKTQEKQADALFRTLGLVRFAQLALSALTTAGFVFVLFDTVKAAAIVGAIASAALLILSYYTKDAELGSLAQRHRQAGNELWLMREKYESLLADIRMRRVTLDDACRLRDSYIEELHALYSGAPSTNSRAYNAAQKALKQGDMTLTHAEINHFLPAELHSPPSERREVVADPDPTRST